MDIPKHTVAITHDVSDVVIIINLLHVQTRALIHQNAHFVPGITQQVTKVAQSTEIFSVAENKLQKVIFYLIMLEIKLQMEEAPTS